MTLLRQLLASVTVAILLILTFAVAFSTYGVRGYLNEQLHADSENAATTLALSIAGADDQDVQTYTLFVASLFDSGRFKKVEMVDTKGQVLVSRESHAVSEDGPPAWFSQLLPLETPLAQRAVSTGWMQVGKVIVIADDSEAREALWQTTLRIVLWGLLTGVLWAIFVWFTVHWMRTALRHEITRQVDAIVEGRTEITPVTSTVIADLLPREQVLVKARERVYASRQEATARIQSLTIEVNQDPVTQLPNRRYFINELRRSLSTDADHQKNTTDVHQNMGFVLLARQRDLGQIAAALSHQEVDQWLYETGQLLIEVANSFKDLNVEIGRLNGSDFAVLMNGGSGPDVMLLAQELRRALMTRSAKLAPRLQARWAFAMTDYERGNELPEVFARLDNALMKSESAGHGEIETLLLESAAADDDDQVMAGAKWRQRLEEALSNHSVQLSCQLTTYVSIQGDPIETHDASLTLLNPHDPDAAPLSGFVFFPVAVRMGLSGAFDLKALKLACEWLGHQQGQLVIRFSVPSLLEDDFADKVRGFLSEHPQTEWSRLVVELDAWALSAYPSEVGLMSDILREAGVRIGLRSVNQHMDVIAHLEGLPLAYLKVAGGFMSEPQVTQGGLELLSALLKTAQSIQVRVLSEPVPSTALLNLLEQGGVYLRE
ncbi:LapD/MoxY N-terminal periplasmic domain-containing protein [Orrella sp. 11846]|uniref:bifunctional diguanylate cyclase/phosphodiesterase n=1 Tax=Orrella sp. 11846 TaxID=3409913 RepID=UPI003B5BFC05